jgi:UDP-3-O-[3-hydroxymyristoyl] glucosamine N-acyltransferase
MAAILAVLARLVDGHLLGDGAVEIVGAATLPDAGEGDITLVDKNEKAERLAATKARAVIVPFDFRPDLLTMPAIQVADVHQAFAKIVSHLRPARTARRIGVSPQAIVSPTARISSDVDVHPGATIGDDVEIESGSTIHSGAHVMAGCRLAERVTLYPNVVLYENTIVGPGSVIHAGSVVGGHGFGYRFQDGRHQPGAQLGNVEIGAEVEIGACTTVDRGTYGPTRIGDGTKIDNLVMIAHNCRIGRHNIICSQVGIAGSTSTGDFVVMAGQVGVRDHVHIGDGAVLAAMAGITNDVPPGARMLGAPATPEREQKLRMASVARLPEMRKKLNELERAFAAWQSDHEPPHSQQAA